MFLYTKCHERHDLGEAEIMYCDMHKIRQRVESEEKFKRFLRNRSSWCRGYGASLPKYPRTGESFGICTILSGGY